MSCQCSLCKALGALDINADSVATTQSPEEIERHMEVHRKQLRFIMVDDSSAVESGGTKKATEDGTSKKRVKGILEDPEKRKSLEDHCRAISLKSQTHCNTKAFCNLCQSLKAVSNTHHLYAPFAFRHAQVHLGKMMYGCRHCDRRYMRADCMQKHLKTVHKMVGNFPNHFDDESGNHFEEIKDMVSKCFDPRIEPSGPKPDKAAKASSITASGRIKVNSLGQKSNNAKLHVNATTKKDILMGLINPNEKETIVAHCRSILPNRPKGSDNLATCKVCREKKAVYYSSGMAKPQLILRHVQRHLGHSVYFCKLCDAQFASDDCIQHHMRVTHQGGLSADNYKDKSGDFTDEIKDMITKCFGQQQGQRSVQFKKKIRTHDQRVKPKLTGLSVSQRPNSYHHDRLTKIRQDHCWRLVQKVKNRGQIQCKQCDISVLFSATNCNAPWKLRLHIFSKHLSNLAVYRCRLCPFKTAVNPTMYNHIKRRHRSGSFAGKFINHENEFHEEIMSELSACFGLSGSQGGSGKARSVAKRIRSAKSIHRRPVKPCQNGGVAGTAKSGKTKGITSPRGRPGRNRDPFFRRVTNQCIELIRKTSAKTIDCQVCPNGRLATYPCAMIHHVEAVHLQKDLYGCRRCPLRFFSHQSMGVHLRYRHKLARTQGQYDFNAEENHAEMISLIKECFDRSCADTNGAVQFAADANPAASTPAGSLTKDSLQPGSVPEDDTAGPSTSNKVISSRMKRYECQVCHSLFGNELIFKKHMACFHS